MNNLLLSSCLGIKQKEIISIYGAGGKTSLLYLLAGELAGGEKKVVVTTTTKIFQHPSFPLILAGTLTEVVRKLRLLPAGRDPVVLAAGLLPEGKLKGIDPSWPGRIVSEPEVSFALAECDGAARKPLKGYASHEPVLPPDSGLALPVMGLIGLGTALSPGTVHRPELFSIIARMQMGETITAEHLVRGMKWMVELGCRQAPGARTVPVFNQADLISDPGIITKIADLTAGIDDIRHIVFTSACRPVPLQFIFGISGERAAPEVSRVVLAAGLSRRMGKDKMTLELGDSTVLEQTLQNLIRSSDGEIIVVINPETAWLGARLSRFKLKVVINERAQLGISTSLQAGLSQVSATSQGAMFILGDQPFIPARVYSSLLERYRSRLPLAVYPTYRGRRGNPVLFDRRTWPMLMELKGDRGGSQLLHCLSDRDLCPVEVDAPEILMDLDTPDDYLSILNQFRTEAGG